VLIYEPRPDVPLEQLADELTRAFSTVRDAVADGQTVVICLDDGDLQGTGDPAKAALAHGLLGLARAVAIEGRTPGWGIAVISSTAEVSRDQRGYWIEQLGKPGAASGALLRLGGEHLGRLPT
jgi:hypothetical protein